MVSIIIPCYNAETLIGEAIESALNQTWPNVEVIVIDDGSTDGSLDVIRSFGARIRWETGPNRGACAARNRGLELARGELIQFLDADDLLFADKLTRMVPLVESLPTQTVIVCNRKVIGGKTGEKDRMVCLKPETDPLVMALEQIITSAAPLYPVDPLRELGGYREELMCCQDYELHLRMALSGWGFEVLEEPLFVVRRHSGSISANLLRVYKQQVALWDEIVVALGGTENINYPHRAVLARLYAGRARWFNRIGCLVDAEHCFAMAEQLDPMAASSAFGSRTRLISNIIGKRLTDRLIGLGFSLWRTSK